MGRFHTEREVLLQSSNRISFKSVKLIEIETSHQDLTIYSNALMNKSSNEQLVFYLNVQRISDSLIIHSGDLFDSVIIDDEMLKN